MGNPILRVRGDPIPEPCRHGRFVLLSVLGDHLGICPVGTPEFWRWGYMHISAQPRVHSVLLHPPATKAG